MLIGAPQRRVFTLALGMTTLAAVAAQAQAVNQYGNPFKHTPKPTTAAITADELRTRLYIFSDDTMMGRRVATIGNMKGTAYIAAELTRLGVEPGGDNGSYFQRLPYVTRKFGGTPSLSAGGVSLTYLTDFVAIPGAMAPRPINNVAVIFGGVDGDTAREITPAAAAGKFVILTAGAGNSAAGGRGAGGAGANNAPALPIGCPIPAGRGGAGGGRGGAGGNGSNAAARFPDAAGVAVIDLDALSNDQRMAFNNPTTAVAVGAGRGGAPTDANNNPANVPIPNPAFRGTAGDLVVTHGNAIGVVRNGALVSGSLPTGWTVAAVQQKTDSLMKKSADSTAKAVARRDTVLAAARGAIAAHQWSASLTYNGEAIRLDSGQVVTLGCAPVVAGRGAAGGAGRGGRGGNGGAVAAVPASFEITAAGASKLLGKSVDGLQPGTVGGNVTASLDYREEPSDWARNVVGIVRGSDPALRGEYVAIGAHNDHNGFNNRPFDHDSAKAFNAELVRREMSVVKGDLRAITADQRASIRVNMDSVRKLHPVARMDSIQNGADDDGSGSMGVLEIAEAIAKMPIKPKRSIIFVWHTGEESGLLGSTYFTANPTVPVDSVVAQINIDMIGRGRAEDMVGGGPTYLGAVGSKRLSMDLNRQMLAVNAMEPAARKLRIDYRFDDATLGTAVDGKPVSWPGYNNIYGRSDHANYANKCIPIVFFFTGLHGDYHQNTDEAEYIDYPHYSLIDNYIKDLLVDVANRPTRPQLNNVCTRR